MLGSIQIQLEHDPIGLFGQLATLASENRAERARSRPGTNHHPMAQLLEEPAIGGIRAFRDIEEYVVLHLGLLSLQASFSASFRLRSHDPPGEKVIFVEERTSCREHIWTGGRPIEMRRTLLVAYVLIFLAACSSQVPVDATATITGRLVAGPTCPVETDPPDPACAPSAVPRAEIVVVSTDGVEIRTRSGQDGTFRIAVPPGEITITFAEVEGLMIAPEAITASVETNQTLDLSDLFYDTGIR